MNPFETRRTFKAKLDDIFDAWTNEDLLVKWWAPYGFELTIFKLDLSVGGVFHYKMSTVDGYEMYGRFIYAEIQQPDRLVFINSFADKNGKIARAPFSDEWPLEIRNELTFSKNNNQTNLHLKVNPVNATEIEWQTFNESLESLQHGFEGTFDRLENFLSEVKNR